MIMFSKTLTLLALATTSVFAIPTTTPQSDPTFFGNKIGIEATGPGIKSQQITASKGSIFIGGKQSPKCEDNQHQDYATFALYSDGTVFLWKVSNPPQQLWVDASGMGMGVSGYTSNDQKPPRNSQRGKFVIEKDGNLTFNGTGAKACPTGEKDKWSIWFTTNDKPGWQDGCVDVKLKAYKTPARAACEYSSSD